MSMNLQQIPQTKKNSLIDLDSYGSLVQDANQDFVTASKISRDNTGAKTELLIQQALHKVKLALNLNPTGIKGLNLLSRIELHQGNYSAAKAIITHALKIKPDSPTALYSAGHIALAIGDFKSAETHFSKSLKISKTATRSASSLAYTFLESGKYVESFQLYQELIKTQSHDPHIRNKLFEAASHITADFYSDELNDNLQRYLLIKDVDYSLIRNLITSLLHHKLQINKEGTPLEFDTIANDALLLTALKKFYFCDELFEQLFITLRQSLLFSSAQNMEIKENHLPLAEALAAQAQLNEYIWPVTTQEAEIVDSIENLLSQIDKESDWSVSDIAPALLIISQYKNLENISISQSISHKITGDIPHYLKNVLNESIIVRQEEISRAKKIAFWSGNESLQNTVSTKVQEQYEENPYPRWTEIGFNTKSSYKSALINNFSDLKSNHWQESKKLNILVAGCGTGRQAIRLASYFNDVNIIAIDLSRRSLAYAQKKAERYDVRNIQFIQADILNFTSFPMQFDVIECSGVLHHMENPQQGLSCLKELLAPSGVMKLALYSTIARKQIIEFRNLLKQAGETIDLRLIRQALLMNQVEGNWQDITQSDDFYSMSDCRDLIFHEHEHQFNLLEVEALLAQEQLEFIGMLADKPKQRSFVQQQNPKSLLDWHTVELQDPKLFSEMYQFYCQVK